MDHGKIVSRAWDITWNNRVLWGLGFLAALGGGGGSSSGGRSSFNADDFDFDSLEGVLPPEYANGPLGQLVDGIFDPEALIAIFSGAAVLICILLIISFVLWFVAQAARAGLIKSVVGLQDGQKIGFKEAFRDGWQYVGRIIGMKLLIYFSFFAIIFGLAIAAGVSGAVLESPFLLVLIVPLMCLMMLVIIPLQFADALAFRGIVLKDMGVVESIKHGWQVFRESTSDFFILGLLYTVIGMVVALIIGAVLGIFAFLSANPVLEYFKSGELSSRLLITGILSGLVIMIVGAFMSSLLVAWRSTGFTLAYQELTGMTAVPLKEKAPEDIGYDGMI